MSRESDVAAGTKRTAANAELETNDAKRVDGERLLTDMTPLDCRIVIRSSPELSARFSDRPVTSHELGECLLSMSVADQVSLLRGLRNRENLLILYHLLRLLVSEDLFLFPIADGEVFMFDFMTDALNWPMFQVICTITNPKILHAKDSTGDGLLNLAVMYIHKPAIEWLLSHDVAITTCNDGYSLFHAMIICNNMHPDEDYCSVIAMLNRARQLRPNLFDPNQVTHGKTALGHFEYGHWDEAATTWMMAMDSNCLSAPDRPVDVDLIPFDWTHETYPTAVDNLCSGSESRFAQLVEAGIQLRGHKTLLFDAIESGRVDIVREFARQKFDFHCFITANISNMPFNVFPFAKLCQRDQTYEYNVADQYEIASIIIANGGVPSQEDIRDGAISPQLMAIVFRSSTMLRYMINNKFDFMSLHHVVTPRKLLQISLLQFALFPYYSNDSNEDVVQLLLDGGASANIDNELLDFLDRIMLKTDITKSLICVANACSNGLRQRALDIALKYSCVYNNVAMATDLLNKGAKCSAHIFTHVLKSNNRTMMTLLVSRMPEMAEGYIKIADNIRSIVTTPSVLQ